MKVLSVPLEQHPVSKFVSIFPWSIAITVESDTIAKAQSREKMEFVDQVNFCVSFLIPIFFPTFICGVKFHVQFFVSL